MVIRGSYILSWLWYKLCWKCDEARVKADKLEVQISKRSYVQSTKTTLADSEQQICNRSKRARRFGSVMLHRREMPKIQDAKLSGTPG